ncbi:unnamed protein product [Diplocarpon coronariae]
MQSKLRCEDEVHDRGDRYGSVCGEAEGECEVVIERQVCMYLVGDSRNDAPTLRATVSSVFRGVAGPMPEP